MKCWNCGDEMAYTVDEKGLPFALCGCGATSTNLPKGVMHPAKVDTTQEVYNELPKQEAKKAARQSRRK